MHNLKICMYALFKCHIFITPCIRTHTSPPGRCSPETYAYLPKTQGSVRQGHSHVAEAMQFQPGVFANPALGKNTTDPHGFIKQPIQYTSIPLSKIHNLHFTLYTSHSALHPFYPTHPAHSALHTLQSTPFPPHTTRKTPHSRLKTPHSTVYTARSRHSSLCTQRPALHTLDFAPHGLHSRSTLSNSHFRLHTLHSTLCAAHSTLQTLQSKLYIPHSTPHLHASPTSPQCYFFLTRFRRCAQTHQAHHLQNIMFRSIHSTARCEGVPKIDAKLYPQTPTANKKPRFFGAFGKERREHSWQARRAFCDKRQIFPLKVLFL